MQQRQAASHPPVRPPTPSPHPARAVRFRPYSGPHPLPLLESRPPPPFVSGRMLTGARLPPPSFLLSAHPPQPSPCRSLSQPSPFRGVLTGLNAASSKTPSRSAKPLLLPAQSRAQENTGRKPVGFRQMLADANG